MTLVDRVHAALGPGSDVGWPAAYVLPALQAAATLVWADTMRPTHRFTLVFSEGEAPIPSGVWPMNVVTPNVKVVHSRGRLYVYPMSVEEVEMVGSPVPAQLTEVSATTGWEPALDEIVVLLAASILLADTRPDAAAAYAAAAEDLRRQFMTEWRNSQEWRLRRGSA